MHTLCTPPSFRLPSARRNTPICSVDGAFSLHSTNGRKQKSRQKALLPRPSDGYRVQNKNASIVSILTFLYGGEGGIWTLAPVTRPTPLAGAPLHHLSTSPKVIIIKYSFNAMRQTIYFLAERVGFEPTVPFGITGFQDQLLKPLGHLSTNILFSCRLRRYLFYHI